MQSGLIENTRHKSIMILPSFESPNMKCILSDQLKNVGKKALVIYVNVKVKSVCGSFSTYA
jgi:hypothetical protein